LPGCNSGSDLSTTDSMATTTTSTASGASTTTIAPFTTAEAVIYPYPDYKGDVHVAGTVTLEPAADKAVKLSWKLTGVEANACKGAPPAGVANACGVHIHVGMGCKNASAVGGHYYDANIKTDPWSASCYNTSNTPQQSEGSNVVDFGEVYESIAGRAFVVHDSTGARIGCGEISPKSAISI